MRFCWVVPSRPPRQQTGAYAKYTVLNGLDYGEWCEPGITPMQAMMNPRKSVGTAYLAYSGRLLAEIAQALGKAKDAAQYRDTAEKGGQGIPRRLYGQRKNYFGPPVRIRPRHCLCAAGRGGEPRRCGYPEPDGGGKRLPPEHRLPFYTPSSARCWQKYGYADTAYKLLLQDTAPSWLYEVKQGATTVWETWTGIDANGHPSESLNHYSYGAICGWLFGGVCGIHLAGGDPDHRPHPEPGSGLGKSGVRFPGGAHRKRLAV